MNRVEDSIKPEGFNKSSLACACLRKRSEYNKNYYQKHKEEIIKKHLEYYKENKEDINNRFKQYNIYYYQKNKEKIIARVQRNYYSKIHAIKVFKPPIIPKKNEILENNIIISLMD